MSTNNIKHLTINFLRKSKIGSSVLFACSKNSYLKDLGWFTSFESLSSVDAQNNPLPWITYPSIEFLESRLNREFVVFEFGAGNSTFWYSKKVKSVFSVEHNKLWFKNLKDKLPNNCTILFEEENSTNYEKKISSLNLLFDIIVVDGIKRNECIVESEGFLCANGVIILDNSERKEYNEGINFLLKKGYKKIDFWGLAPSLLQKSCTSIFYRKENCLDI